MIVMSIYKPHVCCRVETSDGFDIVIDCGSGFRVCAQHLVKKWAETNRRELFIR